ncbi:MAG: YtxH domain-containing protein [Chloroflexi bacterium]|nr:YtxH domain-containing protein [Chloroflexota bacterium]
MSNRDSGPGFAIGLILGVAVGVALGLLFTPRAGKETRELLKDKATDVSEKARELTADREKVYKETWKKRRGQPKVSDAYFE